MSNAPTNGWDALMVVAFFALVGFVAWCATRGDKS